MNDDGWFFLALLLAYVVGMLAIIIDKWYLLVVALSIFPIIMLWRCGDEREKKKPT